MKQIRYNIVILFRSKLTQYTIVLMMRFEQYSNHTFQQKPLKYSFIRCNRSEVITQRSTYNKMFEIWNNSRQNIYSGRQFY